MSATVFPFCHGQPRSATKKEEDRSSTTPNDAVKAISATRSEGGRTRLRWITPGRSPVRVGLASIPYLRRAESKLEAVLDRPTASDLPKNQARQALKKLKEMPP
jgi:hypothetical protein